jgi:hypothetical protein
MKNLTRVIVFGLLAMSLTVGRAYADDNKGSNTTKETAKPTDQPTSVGTAQVAGNLAAWARSNHDAVALATAARVLAADPTQAMPNPDKIVTLAKETDDVKPAAPVFTPESLIQEAKTMAKDNPDTLASVQAIEKSIPASRGHPGGAIIDHDVLPPGGSMTYTITFSGGDPMEIAVFADTPGMIDWHVYDENGNEIDSESSDHFVNVPKWTGPFHVVLSNTTGGYVPYSFATN